MGPAIAEHNVAPSDTIVVEQSRERIESHEQAIATSIQTSIVSRVCQTWTAKISAGLKANVPGLSTNLEPQLQSTTTRELTQALQQSLSTTTSHRIQVSETSRHAITLTDTREVALEVFGLVESGSYLLGMICRLTCAWPRFEEASPFVAASRFVDRWGSSRVFAGNCADASRATGTHSRSAPLAASLTLWAPVPDSMAGKPPSCRTSSSLSMRMPSSVLIHADPGPRFIDPTSSFPTAEGCLAPEL